MKTYKYIQLACMVALMGAATGCADDALVEENLNTEVSKEQRITIQASVGDSDSRVDFGDEVDNKISLTWQSDDKLKVVNPATKTIADFALTSGEGTASGVFEGTASFNDGDKLYAFYNNGMATTDITDEGNVVLTLKNQDGTLKNDNNLLMYGETSYKDGAMQEVSLNPLFSILKVTIPTDKTLKQVSITSGDFRNKATLLLNADSEVIKKKNGEINMGDLVYNYDDDEMGNNSDITVTGEFAPDDNGIVTVYFYVFPSKRYDEHSVHYPNLTPRFKAVDIDGVVYDNSKRFAGKDFSRGKMYRMSSGIFHVVDFDNEETAKGTPDDPFEIANVDQLYSLFLKVHGGYSNNGQSYEDCHYKLTNDIEMDGRVLWGGINLYGSFDGDGHKISGPANNSFISDLFGGSIKNLVLDLEIQGNVHASLLMRSYGGTIINCVNQSSFSTNKDLVGGLVADMITDSKMIACANLGNITVNAENVQSVGGLVGNLSSGSTIEGCYSTGTVTVSATNGNVGTLVGKIEGSGDTGNSLMTACWSREKGSMVGSGIEDTDYAYCIKIATTAPSFDNITSLNEGLTSIGSICRFNEQGIPVIGTASSGTANGSNFGNGGEF